MSPKLARFVNSPQPSFIKGGSFHPFQRGDSGGFNEQINDNRVSPKLLDEQSLRQGRDLIF